MKCQILFSGKNKKNIAICHLLKILPGVLSIKENRCTIKGNIKGWPPFSLRATLKGQNLLFPLRVASGSKVFLLRITPIFEWI